LLTIARSAPQDMTRIKIKELLKSTAYGTEVLVKGWVRTKRENKAVAFIALNDGSIITNVQYRSPDPSISICSHRIRRAVRPIG